MRFNTEAHGEALHARPAQIMEVVRVVEDEVQRFSELAAGVGQHRHLVVLARQVPLRKPLVIVINVLRSSPGTHDGGVIHGRDDDLVDVFLRKRLGCREVARDVLRGSGGREGARQPEEDDAAALAALREVHLLGTRETHI